MIERSLLLERIDMRQFIRHSNLIEGVNDAFEDQLSLHVWEWLAAQPRLSWQILMDIHKMIMLGKVQPHSLGQIRHVDVLINSYKAPIPYTVSLMLPEWLNDMRSWRLFEPRLMHVRFEKIHPFIDGNGRVGRMIMWWHELKLGKTPSLILSDDRSRKHYYDWFK